MIVRVKAMPRVRESPAENEVIIFLIMATLTCTDSALQAAPGMKLGSCIPCSRCLVILRSNLLTPSLRWIDSITI
jgi:hypothetical protein